MKRKTNGIKILQEYLKYPTSMSKYLSRIQFIYLKDPYKSITWLFTRAVGEDSTTTILILALCILHFIVHNKSIFDWASIISSEVTT